MNKIVLNFDYADWETPKEFFEAVKTTISNREILGFYIKATGTKIPTDVDPIDKMDFEFDIKEDQLVVTILYPTVWWVVFVSNGLGSFFVSPFIGYKSLCMVFH